MRNPVFQGLLVVVLILLLANMIRPKLVDSPPARIKATMAQMGALRTALEMFKEDNGNFPLGMNALSDLVAKPTNASPEWHQYLDRVPLDSWGHPYRYEFPGKHDTNSFDLSSAGPDGVFGTADDIVNWDAGNRSK